MKSLGIMALSVGLWLVASGNGLAAYPSTNPAAVAAQRGATAAVFPGMSQTPPSAFNVGRWAWSEQYGWTWYPSAWRPPADPAKRSRVVNVAVGIGDDGNPIYRRVVIPPPDNHFQPRPGTFGY